MMLPTLLRAALCAIILAVSSSPVSASVTASDFAFRSYTAGGLTVPYRMYSPASLQAGTTYPLIIFLHGIGERGTDNAAQLAGNCQGSWIFLSDTNQAKQKCFFIAPQCPGNIDWGDGQMETNLAAIVQQLPSSFAIDPDRIYITGISLGGAGTWAMMANHGGLFACAIPQSGWGAGNYASFKTVPLWCFHANDDGVVGVGADDGAIAAMRTVGGEPIYTRYDFGNHGIWSQAYATPPLFDWMVAQRRSAPQSVAPAVHITSPTSSAAWTTNQASASFAGDASAIASVTSVAWQYTNTDSGEAGYQAGTAAGTSSWSFGPVTLRAGQTVRMRALATGTSWSSVGWAGNTTFSDSIAVTQQPGAVDGTPPAVTITSPTAATTWTAGSASLALGGTASDNVGVTSVTWSSDRGGSGSASGTGSWSVASIALQAGSNVITVTASDAAGNTATDAITVSWTAPSGTGAGTGTGTGTPGTGAGGFAAQYFHTIDLTGSYVSAGVSAIDFDWGAGSPDATIGIDNFSARWTGTATPTTSGSYTFFATGDDGVRLWVDGVLVIDHWVDQAATEYSAVVTLTAGVAASIRMEYYDHGGSAVARLMWSSAGVPKQAVQADTTATQSQGSHRCGFGGAAGLLLAALLLGQLSVRRRTQG